MSHISEYSSSMDTLRISTMTQIAHISSAINLQKLYEVIPLNTTITYVSLGDKSKGYKKKQTPSKRFFFNQMTIHLQLDKNINMKLFNNGGIQMTGLKTHSQGPLAINTFISEMYKYPDSINEIFTTTVERPTMIPEITDMNMVMINSDFDIGFSIDREALHRAIIQAGLYSSFDNSIYPGVNIKYYYHPSRDNVTDVPIISPGVCQCNGMCNGKGLHGYCKKITIAAFKSGKIIITGGRSKEHITTAYSFITKFINDRKDQIKLS